MSRRVIISTKPQITSKGGMPHSSQGDQIRGESDFVTACVLCRLPSFCRNSVPGTSAVGRGSTTPTFHLSRRGGLLARESYGNARCFGPTVCTHGHAAFFLSPWVARGWGWKRKTWRHHSMPTTHSGHFKESFGINMDLERHLGVHGEGM